MSNLLMGSADNLTSSPPEVVDSTEPGEGRDRPDQRPGPARNTVLRCGVANHDDEREEDLQERAGFAPDAGRKAPHAQEQDESAARSENQKIPRKNLNYQPPRDAGYRRQRYVHRAEEELVGDRIEIRAQPGGYSEAPRQGAIDRVRQPGGQHDRKSASRLLAENGL